MYMRYVLLKCEADHWHVHEVTQQTILLQHTNFVLASLLSTKWMYPFTGLNTLETRVYKKMLEVYESVYMSRSVYKHRVERLYHW